MVRVRDALDTRIVTFDENTPALDVVKAMVEKNVWSVVITKGGLPYGLMTERDFIRRCIVPGLDPSKTPVGKLASAPLITIDPDAPLGEALRTMVSKHVRRLFVIEGGKVVGRVTHSSLLEKTLDTFEALHAVSQMV